MDIVPFCSYRDGADAFPALLNTAILPRALSMYKYFYIQSGKKKDLLSVLDVGSLSKLFTRNKPFL